MPVASRVLALFLFVAAVACSGGDDAPSPTSTPSSPNAGEPEPRLTPNPTWTPVPGIPTPVPIPPAALVPYQPGEPLQEWTAYLYDTTDGTFQRLVGWGLGVWSPDSEAMAWSVSCVGDGFVEILDVANNDSVRVEICSASSLRWSPSGSQLGFVVIEPPDDAGVYVMNRDGTGARRLVAQEGVDDIRWLGETAIAYGVGEGPFPPEVDAYFRVDLATEAVTELTIQDPVTANDPRIIFGEASASGTWVAFDNGEATHLWSTATGVTMQIGEGDTRVLWAPQADRLMVTSFKEGEPWPVWRLVDPVAGTSEELPGVGIGAQWMADGQRILHGGYQCYVDGPRTFPTVFDTRNGISRVLTDTPEDREWGLRASSGASQAAFQLIDFDCGTRYLTLIDLDTGEQEVLVSTPTGGDSLSPGGWSPDGRYLPFFYGGGGEGC